MTRQRNYLLFRPPPTLSAVRDKNVNPCERLLKRHVYPDSKQPRIEHRRRLTESRTVHEDLGQYGVRVQRIEHGQLGHDMGAAVDKGLRKTEIERPHTR